VTGALVNTTAGGFGGETCAAGLLLNTVQGAVGGPKCNYFQVKCISVF
jgi:hypothetical protein